MSTLDFNSRSKKQRIFRVILLGAAATGKTSLINQFVDNSYATSYKATLGVDMRTKDVMIDEESVMLQIWDTAGQERFRFNALTSTFLRGADMCFLVYDMTRSDTFDAIPLWRDHFLASTLEESTFPFALIANKCDIASQRAVSQRRAVTWCAEHENMPYFEVSAKQATNVQQAFMELVRRVVRKRREEEEEEYTRRLQAASDPDSAKAANQTTVQPSQSFSLTNKPNPTNQQDGKCNC